MKEIYAENPKTAKTLKQLNQLKPRRRSIKLFVIEIKKNTVGIILLHKRGD